MPVLRSVKNIVKNYTDAEVKVREATSNDPWGPSSTLMAEIADLTYNVVAFTEIMQMVWKRLNDHGKNWRHVYKSLTLLEYIMKTGSEKVAQQCKENIFAIQTLKDFQHLEDNKDLGANVREKAKGLVALLKDDERLKNERAKALKAKERFTENFGIGSDSTSTQLGRPRHKPMGGSGSTEAHLRPQAASATPNSELEEARPHSAGEEELQLQLALAMSKEEAETDAKKKTNDDLKLQMALEESKREDEQVVNDEPRFVLAAPAAHNPHLLDFAAGGAPAATNDPWNPTVQPTAAVVVDAWLTQPVASSGMGGPSPFSPVLASTDPWETPAAAAPAPVPTSTNNPWDDPAPVSLTSNDPWATGGGAAPAAAAGFAAPWDTPAGVPANGSHKPLGMTMDDDFELLTKRSTPVAPSTMPVSASMGADTNGTDLFNMSAVQSSLPPAQMGGTKRPEDFLDPTSKGLVNLDSLVTKPQSSAGVINPFAMTSVGANGGQSVSMNSNPFSAQQPPRPSLNQMSTTNQMTGFNSAPPLLNPMMPTAAPQNAGYPVAQQPMMYQQPTQPAAYNMNNPFL